jgi:hypothetical protein
MAEITRVRITGGSVSVEINVSYRWYVPGNDPWNRVSGASSDFPSSGEWENRAFTGGSSNVRLYSSADGHFATLLSFKRIKVGSTGDGEFYGSGYTIPELSTIKWQVLSVKK